MVNISSSQSNRSKREDTMAALEMNSPLSTTRLSSRDQKLSSSRAAVILAMKARQCAKIAELREILWQGGYRTLDRQATALGLSRSTAWAILQASHKSSGLSGSIIKRMSQSPELPPAARRWIEDYVAQKLAGKYGHSQRRLRVFQAQIQLYCGLPRPTRSIGKCAG